MNIDQAIFQAASATEHARSLVGDLWKGAAADLTAEGKSLDRHKCIGLRQAAEQLKAAALQLETESRKH